MEFTAADIARADYAQVSSMTGFPSGGAPVIFDLPAQPNCLLDLRTSKLILSFTLTTSMTRDESLGWMAGLLACSSVRVYLNGREVGIDGNLAHFAAFHRCIFQRGETQPALRGWKSDDVHPIAPPEQQISGITSPWKLPTYAEYTAGASQAEFGFNDRAWAGAMYNSSRLVTAGDVFQLALPLDLLVPLCDDGRLLDNSVTSIRMEFYPSNTTFQPCKTLDALNFTPLTAVFWARRVTLRPEAWARYQAKWAADKVLRYPINLYPATTTFRLAAGTTAFNGTILASGSRPAQLVVHICQAGSLNLSSWTATKSVGPPVVAREHVYQCADSLLAPVVTSMVARSQSKMYPWLYTLHRGDPVAYTSGTEGGSAILDYEQYVESTKQGRQRDTNKGPFLSYGAYTDMFGCTLFTINLLDNDQSTWNAERSGERTSLDLQISFASPVPTGDLAMIVTVLGAEEVQISATGNVGKTW